jgi:hypothetical protein
MHSSKHVASTASLVCGVKPVAELDSVERRQLYELMSGHFANVSEAQFFADLDEKPSVVLVRDAPSGRLRGFSTLKLLETSLDGEPLVAVFAGDTVMEPDCWGQYGWVREWGRHAFAMADASGAATVYFLLLTATHRTYRFLPGFFYEYFPRPDRPTPLEIRRRLDALVRLKFPEEYDAQRGVVRLRKTTPVRADRLDPTIADRANDPYVQYFVSANPGFQKGDFLACITELSRANLSPLGRRVTGLLP